jgi:hypothetical protein
MRSVRFFSLAALSLAVLACNDDPLKSSLPETPPPPAKGVQAFVQVDKTDAQPGDQIHVYVRVQLGSETAAKLGSYTGRLSFDPAVLGYRSEVKINDGLRVTNPNGAEQGDLRFAGAAADGFADLTLYEAVFDVKKAGYLDAMKVNMEEMSAAKSLVNLRTQLQQPTQVFFRKSGQ